MCTSGSPDTIEFLLQDEVGCACVFVNFVGETSKWTNKLERSMDTAHINAHVLAINGQMDKHEKFAFIQLFTSAVTLKRFHLHVIVATPATS